MAGLPNNVTEEVRRLNPHVYGSRVVQGPENQIKSGRRVRQESKPLLNRLEERALFYLQGLFPHATIRAQAKRYRLANGAWYKPDFTTQMDGQEFAWEIKGPRAYQAGITNLKFAAQQWPEVNWVLVWVESDGWRSQLIRP